MRESRIENRLKIEARKRGGIAMKFVSPGHDGVADRIVLLPGGRTLFVELKRPGGKLSKLQVHFRNLVVSLGFEHVVIDSIEKVKTVLR